MHDPAPLAPSEGKNNEPLLPALLLSPTALLWLWELPLVVLLLLNWQGYRLIEGNMDAAQHRAAIELGLAGAGNLFAGVATFFALAFWLKRNPDPAIPVPIFPIVGGAIVLFQVAYLWLAMNMESQVLPATVTTWIYPSGRFDFNQFAFAMVPLFYGVLLLSCAWHVENSRRALWISLSLAAGAPVVLFLLAHFLAFKSDFYGVIFAVGLVLLGLVMFVGIIRVLMVGLKSGRRFGPDGEQIAIVVIALVLPVAGLLLNRTIDFPVDFQAWEVYALVVANTAILLTYTAPNEIELRVFPVSANESSMVEIDFLLPSSTVDAGIITSKDPASILTSLGRSFPVQTVPSETGIELAGSLPQEIASPDQRGTYLHVIVDRSIDNGFDGDLAAALRKLKERFPSSHLARITAVNYAVDDVVRRLTPIDELIARPVTAEGTPRQGGLFLDLALAHALKVHRDVDLDASAGLDPLPLRPIFVVLSHHAGTKAPPLELTGQWAPLVDHLELHEIGEDGATVTLLDQIEGPHTWLRLGQSIRLADHGASFASRDESSNVEFWSAIEKHWRPLQEVQRQAAAAAWAKAALLQRAATARAQNPGGTSTTASDLVQASRESGILLPISSYIVVENAAQWQMLAQAEKQKLGQNAALEFVETPAPPALYIGLGFALFLLIRHRRKVLSLVLPTLCVR